MRFADLKWALLFLVHLYITLKLEVIILFTGWEISSSQLLTKNFCENLSCEYRSRNLLQLLHENVHYVFKCVNEEVCF